MGYTLNWHIDSRVLSIRLFDKLSPDDLRDCNGMARRYIRQGTQPIHVIIDTLAVTDYPTNLRWVVHMLQNNGDRAVGWLIVIAEDHNIRLLLATLFNVLHMPFHLCKSLPEALDFLRELEPAALAAAS